MTTTDDTIEDIPRIVTRDIDQCATAGGSSFSYLDGWGYLDIASFDARKDAFPEAVRETAREAYLGEWESQWSERAAVERGTSDEAIREVLDGVKVYDGSEELISYRDLLCAVQAEVADSYLPESHTFAWEGVRRAAAARVLEQHKRRVTELLAAVQRGEEVQL